MEAESEGGRGWEDVATRACVFLLFPSRTNADKHRPRSCDFEALSLIKALIKEKGACYRADNWEKKREKKEQIWGGEVALAARWSARVLFLLIGRDASWHAGQIWKLFKEKRQKPATYMCELSLCPAAICGVSATQHYDNGWWWGSRKKEVAR